MRHIAVRTGKRYGKVSLVDAKHSDDERRRVVRELRCYLASLTPPARSARLAAWA